MYNFMPEVALHKSINIHVQCQLIKSGPLFNLQLPIIVVDLSLLVNVNIYPVTNGKNVIPIK